MSQSERKVAIITGSATGVGAAAALLLAERGCNVVINYTRSKDEAEETASACRAKGAEAITVQADVSNDDDCRAMAQAAIDAWGRIDYLINNAARTKFNPYPNLEGVDKDDFLNIYAVNVVGAYQMVRAVVPHMKKLGKGAIVNDFVNRRRHGHCIVDSICCLQGGTEPDDQVAGPCTRPRNPDQQRRARHDSDALAQRRHG